MTAYWQLGFKRRERNRRFRKFSGASFKPSSSNTPNPPAPRISDANQTARASQTSTGAKSLLALVILFLWTAALPAATPLKGQQRSKTVSSPTVAAVCSISEAAAVNAILGEASNQGKRGMLAVADAIRNRRTLNGVYGVNNPVVRSASPKLRALALAAWHESARHDITGGATHWGNKTDVQRNSFYSRLTFTARIGDHYFFRA